LFQACADRANQHLPAPLGTPDEVVDNQVDGMPFVLILHAYSITVFNSACKSEGPFIPWLKTRGFLAHFCKLGIDRRTAASLTVRRLAGEVSTGAWRTACAARCERADFTYPTQPAPRRTARQPDWCAPRPSLPAPWPVRLAASGVSGCPGRRSASVSGRRWRAPVRAQKCRVLCPDCRHALPAPLPPRRAARRR